MLTFEPHAAPHPPSHGLASGPIPPSPAPACASLRPSGTEEAVRGSLHGERGAPVQGRGSGKDDCPAEFFCGGGEEVAWACLP